VDPPPHGVEHMVEEDDANARLRGGFGAQGLGFGVWCLVFGVCGFGFLRDRRISLGFGFGVKGLGFGFWVLVSRV
jgi:hypothetical protein